MPKKLRFYGYDKCDTCRKAKKWLIEKGFQLDAIDITENPPSREALEKIYRQSGEPLSAFLNRSGEKYRELNMKEKVKTMSESDLLDLLSQQGRLLKRPLVTGDNKSTVGFKEDLFEQVWK